jgi:hypothetical protein
MASILKYLFTVSALVILSAQAAFCAIETRTVVTWTLDEEENIVVSVDIHNDGEEGAYNLETSMFLGKREYIRGALGDNPPGGRIHLDFVVEKTTIRPGAYTGIVRVQFQDWDGVAHHIHHPVSMVYNPIANGSDLLPVGAKLVDPVFNPKAFWATESQLPVTLENRGDKRLRVRLTAWAPEGFTIRPEAQTLALAPGGEKTLRLFTALSGADRTAGYYLTVEAATEHRHHSMLLDGFLAIKPKPVYFRIYLLLAAAGALLLVVWTIFRHT